MKKTFGSAFALIMVALLTVAPTSPATAAGDIHLHMAGKVGQKAVGTTLLAGTAGFTSGQKINPRTSQNCSANENGCVPLFGLPACFYLDKVDSAGTANAIDPFPNPGGQNQCQVSGGNAQKVFRNGAGFIIPASGNSYFQTQLPELAAGNYMLSFTALNEQATGYSYGVALTLQWIFTIASDGTFSSISAF